MNDDGRDSSDQDYLLPNVKAYKLFVEEKSFRSNYRIEPSGTASIAVLWWVPEYERSTRLSQCIKKYRTVWNIFSNCSDLESKKVLLSR
jgi:hypothetical protein